MAYSYWTNRGLKCLLNQYFRGDTNDTPAAFALAFAGSAQTMAPQNVKTLANVDEFPTANGYTAGGQAFERSAVGWDVAGGTYTPNRRYIQARDLIWNITDAGITAVAFLVLVDDHSTPNVIAHMMPNNPPYNQISQVAGQSITIQDLELRIEAV